MFQLQFEVEGDEQVVRGFSRFAEDVKDLREPFEQIAENFKKGERKQFETEGGYGSGGWAGLKESTIKQKRRMGYPLDILRRTNLLMESLTGEGTGAGWAIKEVESLRLRLGTKIPYAHWHQSGTSKMARRRVIDIPESQKTEWVKIIQRYLVEQARKEFAGLMPTLGAGEAHLGAI